MEQNLPSKDLIKELLSLYGMPIHDQDLDALRLAFRTHLALSEPLVAEAERCPPPAPAFDASWTA